MLTSGNNRTLPHTPCLATAAGAPPASRRMNTTPDDFEIAPNVKASAWKLLDIQRSTKWNRDWETAVTYLKERIDGRFLKQISALIRNQDKATARFSGFAIVALDCLLIETLDQFYKGRYSTPRRSTKTGDPDVEAFHAVFQRSSKLRGIFDTQGKTKVFYQQIRCGLLHQAETKKSSKISRKRNVVVEWCDADRPEEGLVIHPRLFHEAVRDVFFEYLGELGEVKNGNLRGKFKKKMNLIAGL